VNAPQAELLLRSATAAIAANDIQAAISLYAQVVSLVPNRADLHYNLGVLLKDHGAPDRAQRAFADAQRLRPAWPAPALALGHIAYSLERFDEARSHFERALALAPGSIEALCNLGMSVDKLGRLEDARLLLERARTLAPGDETIFLALRTILLRDRPEDALQDLLRFEASAQVTAKLIVTALRASRQLGDDQLERKYLSLALSFPYASDDVESLASVVATLQYFDVAIADVRRLLRRYDELQQARLEGWAPPLRPRRDTRDRIRIGYLSADFRIHVMGLLMYGIIGQHDRSAFSVHAYSLVPRVDEDGMTEHIRGLVDGFVSLAGQDDRTAAARIADDDLDILIDLMGHTAGGRPGLLLYKPAPVIISHLGLHGAIGLRQVDFKLTDSLADTEAAPEYCVEAPLRLEGCVMPFFHAAPEGAPLATRQQLGIDDSAIVFAAFVNLLKLSPHCLALWRSILAAVPGARLAFSPTRDFDQAAFVRRATGFGIPAERLVFIPMTGHVPTDRTRYSIIDIALDTTPYTGGDTTVAALDCGIPVVTLRGMRQAERMGYSLLAHLGVTDTVAATDDEYIAIACRLATDRGYRASLSARIRHRVETSGIADKALYARRLEDAYRRAIAIAASRASILPVPGPR
jgi:protein O-GlcNAc transferase